MIYDLNKIEDKYYIDEMALIDEGIPFYGLYVYSPKITDIIKCNESKYNNSLFMINSDLSFFIEENNIGIDLLTLLILSDSSQQNNINNELNKYILESIKNNKINYNLLKIYKIFDIIKGGKLDGYSHIQNILSIVLRVNKKNISYRINFDGTIELIICTNNNNMPYVRINNDKYEELRNIICEITNTKKFTNVDKKEIEDKINKKQTKKKRYKCLDPAMEESVKKFFEAEEKYYKKETKEEETRVEKLLKFINVFTFVANNNGFDKVKQYNIYQLKNAYEFINYNNNFKFDLMVGSSGYASKNFKIRDIKDMMAK